jgi:hypothetical protein
VFIVTYRKFLTTVLCFRPEIYFVLVFCWVCSEDHYLLSLSLTHTRVRACTHLYVHPTHSYTHTHTIFFVLMHHHSLTACAFLCLPGITLTHTLHPQLDQCLYTLVVEHYGCGLGSDIHHRSLKFPLLWFFLWYLQFIVQLNDEIGYILKIYVLFNHF